jgi:ferritin-like metal-binding protein YciE
MPQLKELLIEELQDLLHAETQLVDALPKMADAAHHPKLQEAFIKHLHQTEVHVQKIKDNLRAFGREGAAETMQGYAGTHRRRV